MDNSFISDIAFSESVKKRQAEMGSRAVYQKMAERRDWKRDIPADLQQFIALRDSFYLASVSAEGQPYVQHRGGPPGFLKVVGPHQLAFADFSGNRQYISLGNVDDNPKVHLFLMDYPNRTRVKIWGEADILDADDSLRTALEDPTYQAKIERIIRINVTAWDINCPQHIQPRFTLEELAPQIEQLKTRIKELEAQVEDCAPKLAEDS